MDKLMLTMSDRRPNFLPWLVKYFKLWFHGPVYNSEEGEEGEGDVLRLASRVRERYTYIFFHYNSDSFLWQPFAAHSCLVTEFMFKAVKRLNLTLEWVECRINGDIESRGTQLFMEEIKYFVEDVTCFVLPPMVSTCIYN